MLSCARMLITWCHGVLPGIICFFAVCPAYAASQTAGTKEEQIAVLQAEMDSAIAEVKRIVNQPVRKIARTRQMKVSIMQSGWFHEGAGKPDFKSVDVRASQELLYDRFRVDYISSDLNPGVAFFCRDLEFNSATKYFYTDYSLPKKKLTEAEMLEINRLYRVIGRCEDEIAKLQGVGGEEETEASQPNAFVEALVGIPRQVYLGVAGGLVLLLVIFRVIRGRSG
jgi:hypothetical protein